MANTPQGTGDLLTEEQKELVVKVSNSDFNSVIENTLARIETFLSNKPSFPSNPTENDIVSLAGNLNAVVPAGFLLIHEDLQKLKGDGAEDSFSTGSFSTSVVSLLTPMLVGAGAAVVATGIVKGLFGGISSSTTNHVQTLVDDLNKQLTAEDLAGDSTVLAAQKIGFIAYMEAYFLQQAASLMISGTLEAVGTSAGKAVVGFFSTLFGKQQEEDTVATKLKSIVEDIIEAQTSSKYIGDSSVETAVKIGIIAYMTTYFASQTAAMAVDTFATNLSSTAGTAANKFITGLFGKDNDPKSYDHIQSIVDDLILAFDESEAKDDKEVQSAISKGLAGYISTYFTSQAAAMAVDTFAAGLASTAGGMVKSFFSNLFGKAEEETPSEKLSNHITEISNTLIIKATQDEEEIGKWEEIQKAVREGLSSYISTYFKSQAKAMTADNLITGLAESAGKAVKGFFTSLFGKKSESEDDPLASKLSLIIDTLSRNLDVDKISKSEEILQGQEEGIKEFVKAYTAQMSDSLIDVSKSDIKAYVKKAWQDYAQYSWGSAKNEAPKQYFSKIINATFSEEGFPDISDFSSIKQQIALDTSKALLTAEVNAFKSTINKEGSIKFEVDSTAILKKEESENNNKMITTLNKISSLLEELSTYVQANSSSTSNNTNNNSNTTIVNVSSSKKDNLSVNIPG